MMHWTPGTTEPEPCSHCVAAPDGAPPRLATPPLPTPPAPPPLTACVPHGPVPAVIRRRKELLEVDERKSDDAPRDDRSSPPASALISCLPTMINRIMDLWETKHKKSMSQGQEDKLVRFLHALPIEEAAQNAANAIEYLISWECSICQGGCRSGFETMLGCGHSFGEECILRWASASLQASGQVPCPLCRAPIEKLQCVDDGRERRLAEYHLQPPTASSPDTSNDAALAAQLGAERDNGGGLSEEQHARLLDDVRATLRRHQRQAAEDQRLSSNARARDSVGNRDGALHLAAREVRRHGQSDEVGSSPSGSVATAEAATSHSGENAPGSGSVAEVGGEEADSSSEEEKEEEGEDNEEEETTSRQGEVMAEVEEAVRCRPHPSPVHTRVHSHTPHTPPPLSCSVLLTCSKPTPPSAYPHSQVDEIDDNGDRRVGKKRGGKWHGVVKRFYADGEVDITNYKDGVDVGQSVTWSADRTEPCKYVDGKRVGDISLEEAAAIAKTYGLDVPPPRVTVRTHHAQPHA